MNKEAFLAELRERLSGLPENELEERIAFYSEMIDDRVEEGATEEEAVAGIGPVKSVVEQIVSEIPLTKLVREKKERGRKLRGGEIALLILGFPLWFPLLIAFAAVLFSLYVVIWSLVISAYAVVLALAAGSVGCFISIVPYLEAGNTAGVFFAVGAGMVCMGIAILLFFACLWFTRWLIRMTGRIVTRIKTLFIGKEV